MILAIETDQLVHMSAETTTKFWTKLEHVHHAQGLTT